MKRLWLRKLALPFALLLAILLPLAGTSSVDAALLLDRSVRLLDPKPGAITSHTIAFNIQASNNVGSIVFEYCSNDPFFDSPCDTPAGMDASATTLTSEAGEIGFTVDPLTTVNRVVLTRPAAMTNVGQAQYVLADITNPTTPNQTVYVRVSLHEAIDGTGPRTDHGAVVFNVLSGIDTRAYVPPHLTFCTGLTVNTDCSDAQGFFIDLGELSSTSANTATSQFACSTNDLTGYSVSIHGITMTSGNDVIPALTVPSPSNPGVSQFGINLRNNSTPNIGADLSGAGTAAMSADYSTVNRFKFKSGDSLASVSTPSDFNRFTVSYLVNVSPNQQPGIYNATFTYIATASF